MQLHPFTSVKMGAKVYQQFFFFRMRDIPVKQYYFRWRALNHPKATQQTLQSNIHGFIAANDLLRMPKLYSPEVQFVIRVGEHGLLNTPQKFGEFKKLWFEQHRQYQ